MGSSMKRTRIEQILQILKYVVIVNLAFLLNVLVMW